MNAYANNKNQLDLRKVENDSYARFHIYLRPRVSLTFDLLAPKVDRFMLLPRGPLVPICIKTGSFGFQNIVLTSSVTEERMDNLRT